MNRLLPVLCLLLLASLVPAVDATLATINYGQGQGKGHKVGSLAVTTTEQQIILNYQPGELTEIQIVAEPTNTTNIKVRDLIGDDTTSRILAPGQSANYQLSGISGVFTFYVIMVSGSGNMGIERVR